MRVEAASGLAPFAALHMSRGPGAGGESSAAKTMDDPGHSRLAPPSSNYGAQSSDEQYQSSDYVVDLKLPSGIDHSLY